MIDIDLYFWPLTGDDCGYRACLSPDEVARADRFVRPGHGASFTIGRGRLREILGQYTGQPADALRFDYNAEGKPSLAGGPLFNLSHAGGWAALAVCAAPPEGLLLGLDIEAHREVEPMVAARFFSPNEVAAMPEVGSAAWQGAFFRIWTRKEAVVKAVGPGLSMPLSDFDVTQAPGAGAAITRIETPLAPGGPADWSLTDLDTGKGMAGALALCAGRGRGCPVPRLTIREGQLPLPR
ncbi:4'-phosphopantetheinyl transferase family protein [Pseudooceanicola sp. 502str34]